MVIWTIECDELPDMKTDVRCSNHKAMVSLLMARGFKRLLKDDVPYQEEPLVYTDKKGRVWDALPTTIETFRDIVSMPHMDVLTNRIIQNEAKAKEA